MPLVKNSNRKYITIDTGDVAFKAKSPDGDILSPTYEGYLVDVEYREDEYQGRPANKYQFIFKSSLDEDADTEIVQSGANSVFSGSMINYLLGIEGTYGKITIGVFQPEGKEFIANWMYHNDEKAEWGYDYDQIQAWAKNKYNGDKTALWKDLYEKKLKEKLEEQGTQATKQAPSESKKLVGSGSDGEPVDIAEDIDDDLPF